MDGSAVVQQKSLMTRAYATVCLALRAPVARRCIRIRNRIRIRIRIRFLSLRVRIFRVIGSLFLSLLSSIYTLLILLIFKFSCHLRRECRAKPMQLLLFRRKYDLLFESHVL